ncbi:aminoglycoside phosphotransferase family protein, partial [Streptomyces sp. NPDC026589]
MLSGGLANAGAVVRHGDAVERPAPPHAALLHAHLRALREQGFDGVPVPLGVSASGRRERLSYVPGEVAVAPHPPWAWTDGALRSVGALLRRMHDAAAAGPMSARRIGAAVVHDPDTCGLGIITERDI